MTTLKQQAEALGIEVNGRWSDETIQKKIDEAKAAKAPSPDAAGTAGTALGAGAAAQPFGGKGDHDGDGRPGGAATSTEAQPGTGTGLDQGTQPVAVIDAKTRLIITAEELGIEVGTEWDEERLRAAIRQYREVNAAQPAPAVSTARVPTAGGSKNAYTLLTDYWDENGDRIPAGTDRKFTDAEARHLGADKLKPKSVFG